MDNQPQLAFPTLTSTGELTLEKVKEAHALLKSPDAEGVIWMEHSLPKKWDGGLFEAAKRKAGQEGWRWCISEVVKGGFIVSGAVPIGTYTKGKRKGQSKWPKRGELDRIIVSDEDVKAEHRFFEQRTGECARCEGYGLKWAGWSRDKGTAYVPCKRCNATGKAPTDAPSTPAKSYETEKA